jgi:GYF domain 2
MAEMWYYTTEGKQMDAVTIKELMRLVGDGTLKPTDMVWKDGLPRWIRASSVKELFPDPLSGLDQYFTSTKEAERKEVQAKAASVTAGSKGTTAAGSNGTMPPTAEEASARKRKPAASDGERPARRPRDTGGGGSNVTIMMALFFGGFLLLGALGVGVFILVFVIPSDADPIANVEKEKKNVGPDVKPPVNNGKDPVPKLDPLPPGVRDGKDALISALIKPNMVFVQKFRVKAGHAASFNVTVLEPKAGITRFKLNVVRDSDQNVELAADPNQPGDRPSVNFQCANTEIVLLRVQNVGKTSNKLSIVYNVSP